MSFRIELFVRVLSIASCIAASSTVPQQAPTLYELDDWTKCDLGPERDWYCMVRVIVVADALQNASGPFLVDDLHHFRRALLDRGLCLTAAQRRFDETVPLGNYPFPGWWNKSDRYMLDRSFFPSSMHPDTGAELAAGAMINRRLQSRHSGLAAYTEIEYCVKDDPTGRMEQAMGVVVAVVLVLGCILLLNGRRWIREECRPPRPGQLLLFDCYKCYGLVGVVLAHCLLFGPFLMPLKDAEQLEQSIAHPNAKLFRLICPFTMLVFFTMSSMLLTVKLLQSGPTQRPTLAAIITDRLIRLQPLNLLTIAFCALAYDRFIGGPLGPRQLIVEQGLCLRRWWMNVLFISNYGMHEPCLPHSWYVSADFQLFVIVAIVLMAMFKWPQHSQTIGGFMIFAAFLGPFLTVLLSDFDPVGPGNLHEMRFFLLDSTFMAQLYTPCYNNLCWSVAGMLAGIMYDRYQRLASDSEARKRQLNRVNATIAVSLSLLVMFVRATIVASDNSSPGSRWWLAVCYSLHKISAAALFGAVFLRVLLTERDFYGSTMVRMGAKLYYCVYLIHMPIFRIMFSNETEVTEVTPILLLRMGMKVFVISYTLAVLLHYIIEKPITRLLRRVLYGRN
ncbi:uncharacterized protein LOC128724699 [Anopheles nili]|uniref:uncharacterized protein LOC128724699 n=1 Tax=Anopheles nili TaxID=185578 RepID=UPI00237A5773|nr:uncharacterized protein LOC128724699 [Anopheles nili]